MLFTNRKLERALKFIRTTPYDVLCLQEVPEILLTKLKKLPLSIAYRYDMVQHFRSGDITTYNVILSPHTIENQDEIVFPDYWTFLPLRTKLFLYLLRPFKFTKASNRGGLYADLRIGTNLVRVFNLHLILAQPTLRLREFENAMTERDRTVPTIVCGDFNILESFRSTPLNWMFGGKFSDSLFRHRERTEIEKHFVSHELVNVLRGKNTHPISRSQLDHILISHDLSVSHASVLPDRIGSDHHPISANISFNIHKTKLDHS